MMLTFKEYVELVEAVAARYWFNTKTKKLVKIRAKYHDWEPVRNPEKFGLKPSQVVKFEADVDRNRDTIGGITKLMGPRGWVRVLVQNDTSWSIQSDTLPQAQDVAKALSKKHKDPTRLFIDYGNKSALLKVGQINDFIKTGKIIQRTEIGATMAMFR